MRNNTNDLRYFIVVISGFHLRGCEYRKLEVCNMKIQTSQTQVITVKACDFYDVRHKISRHMHKCDLYDRYTNKQTIFK